jgi:hypothetical protein
MSYRQAAARAVDPETGQSLGSRWLDRLGRGQLARAPEEWQLRALAAFLDADLDVVQGLADRQWLEFDVAQLSLGARNDWVLYLERRGMSEADRAELRVQVTEFVRRQERRPCEEDPGAGEAHA